MEPGQSLEMERLNISSGMGGGFGQPKEEGCAEGWVVHRFPKEELDLGRDE